MTTERSSQPVGRSGSMQVSPQETTVYTLSAEGGGRTIHQQVIVTVATVKVLGFSATPRNLAQGDKTTFAWETAGAASCPLDPGGIALEPPAAGKLTLPVEVSGFYTLIASGHGRQDPRTVPVTVMPVELTRFGAAPVMVAVGGQVTLSWDAKWATGFWLDPPGQALDRRTSSLTVRPTRTTIYELTARGLEERTAEVTVSAGAAIAAIGLTTNPGNPRVMMLAWEVVHGTAELTVDGTTRPVSPAGNQPISLPAEVTPTATGGGVTTGSEPHFSMVTAFALPSRQSLLPWLTILKTVLTARGAGPEGAPCASAGEADTEATPARTAAQAMRPARNRSVRLRAVATRIVLLPGTRGFMKSAPFRSARLTCGHVTARSLACARSNRIAPQAESAFRLFRSARRLCETL